ncbi:MAG: hypothetical protein AAF152_02350 [Cyanobacteria bacterium P01_A01_bin.114]
MSLFDDWLKAHPQNEIDFYRAKSNEQKRLLDRLEAENRRMREALESVRSMAGSHTISVPETHPAGYGSIYSAADKALDDESRPSNDNGMCDGFEGADG